MKKKLLITLSVVACALLLVAGSIAGTIAYLTSTQSVTNTFTVGNIVITLDEGKVGEDGKFIDADDDGKADSRVSGGTVDNPANKYHLVPDGVYDKDPLITLAANSDSCYLFVKVENGLAAVEETDGNTTIEEQLATNGWKALEGVDNVYVYGDSDVAKSDQARIFPVFTEVIIDDAADNGTLAALTNKTVFVTAYAVQSAGFADAKAAWTGANFS